MSQHWIPAKMQVNKDLLIRTLAHIEAHPEEWDQAAYRRGRSFCFAGHAAMLDGGVLAYPERAVDDLVAVPGDPAKDVCSNGTIGILDRAQRILGLYDDPADRLFAEDNTLDDLRRIVGELAAE